MKLLTASELVTETTTTFEIFKKGKGKLLKTGLSGFDEAFGGLFPRTGNILAADQGVGKSSAALAAIQASPEKSALISLEDSGAMIGARILAAESGVNSLKIIRKEMDTIELEQVRAAEKRLAEREHDFLVCDAVGSNPERVLECIEKATEWGAKIVWLDYIQKLEGSGNDRRNEIASIFRKAQSACAAGGAALVALSQVTDVQPGDMPRAHNLRETRDLANEARVIICATVPDDEQPMLKFYVEKCSYGLASVRERTFRMYRHPCGTLRNNRPR